MRVSRREFLADLGIGLTAGLLPSLARAAPAGGTVLGFGKGIRDGRTLFVAATADVASPAVRMFPLGFFGHGVAFDPARRSRACVFEKKGPGACEIDLVAGKVVRAIPAGPGRAFYGHGIFTADGLHLLAVEIDTATRRGLIAIRDAATLRPIGEFPTHGDDPHDCILADGGRVLVVTNGGKPGGDPPCVTFVDVASHALLDRVRPGAETLNTGHVALDERGDMIVVSAPHASLPPDREGGVSIRSEGAAVVLGRTPPEIGPLTGEALSVAVCPGRRLAAASHPDAGLVTFWDLGAAAYRGSLRFEHPRGLVTTADGAHLAVSHGPGRLALVSWSTLRPIAKQPAHDATPFSGSHLYLPSQAI